MQNPPPPPPPPPAGGYPPPPPALGGYPPAPYQPPMGGGYAPMQGYAPAATYAGFWIRFVAYIIDWLIGLVISFGLGIFLGILAAITNPSNPQATTSSLTGVYYAIGLLIDLAYFVGFWTLMGATLGQRVFNLRVVDAATGQRITFGKALLRWVGLLVSFLVCSVGVIWVAFDPRKQGWMDKIAGTYVLQG